MADPQQAPYGSWRSPITTDLIVAGSISLGQIVLDGPDVYWVEGRPAERGRNVVVRRAPGSIPQDVTPAPFDVRTRVHEYGGGAFTVADGTVYFANFGDQRLYVQQPGATPRALSPAGALRYADLQVDRARRRLIAVREDHSGGGEPVNTLVALSLDGDATGGQVLASGHDFYASPRLSPDGSRLAWLTWNHPNMPWNGTELWVGEIGADGALEQARPVAGSQDESIFQPEWSPDGLLTFVSDRTGWWNLYRLRADQAEPLCPREAEFGVPQWVFGLSTYAYVSADQLICAYSERGTWRLAALTLSSGALEPIETPYSALGGISVATEPERARVVFTAGSSSESTAVVQLDLASGQLEVLRRSNELSIAPEYLSYAQPIEFPTSGGLTAHAFLYRPKNGAYRAAAEERPPLVVFSHGGPTSATSATLNPLVQYWTSRGFAVVDVNYGGSSGYGRDYRQRLDGTWGVVDVDDCANAARYLAERGEADLNRLVIRGGSAGGYTTLAALTFRNDFKGGASYYGISDLAALTRETHKFESRYLDRLVGPYPERSDLYRERSPIYHTDRLATPLILFQGLEDEVVPPDQAVMMYEAVRARGLPVAYVAFEGEQHGFRRAETIKRALEAELYFYSRIFCFEPADEIEPVPIANL